MSLFVLLFGCAVLVVGMQESFIRHTEIDKDFLMPVLPKIKKTKILQAGRYHQFFFEVYKIWPLSLGITLLTFFSFSNAIFFQF